VDDAFFGGAVDLRLELGEKLGGFGGIAGFGESADFLFGSAHGAELGTIEGAATERGTGLLGGGTSISHSPPSWRKLTMMSTRVYAKERYFGGGDFIR
jgi:hypothetical protein